VPELKEMLPEAPFIPRQARDNEDFVKAIRDTGRKKLTIAGVVTDVCVTFPILSALDGYKVFVVTDVSGNLSEAMRQAALTRMSPVYPRAPSVLAISRIEPMDKPSC
jgi:nicotinamidase-related amidase